MSETLCSECGEVFDGEENICPECKEEFIAQHHEEEWGAGIL